MTRTRGLLTAAAIPLILMAGCARPDSAGSAGSAGTAADPITESATAGKGDPTVLVRISQEGGFVPTSYRYGRLPDVTVYADGRVISNGPVPAIAPGPALPNLQVRKITKEQANKWAADALAAGVKTGNDLGAPGVADIPDTVITATSGGKTETVRVTALHQAQPDDPNLSNAQQAARKKLAAYVDELNAFAGDDGPDSFVPDSLAALAQEYVASDDGLKQQPQDWPGPALPGAELSAGTHCVSVDGAAKDKLWAAAGKANMRTPWVSGGKQWQVTFRPLLPDETGGCAALKDAK
ncbi:hypothetical protein GCM10010168_30370 [Actinoplanes ianthinogenes]|uniref:Lipoprotein n=1 Tax=Actinoplanes ianthinogenes TaxID=122358 RepID=A0ABM7LLS0_9ACTN|nr:hypothetical protein [Actinoplanes ianthinogenes]BCJ40179.1 hypothetical protein Aiant_08360 [Actinoplanes ianthinogenes]GGR10780.1 hypothetical protein GCM10010168_30370 [Actinoplanes ianthinogenes]